MPDESTVSTDPGAYTIDGIKEWIEDNPTEADATLAAEKARSDARVTLVTWLESFIARRDADDEPPVEGAADDGALDGAAESDALDGTAEPPVAMTVAESVDALVNGTPTDVPLIGGSVITR